MSCSHHALRQCADSPFRTLFGGPSQPEPLDPRGGIQSARVLGTESDATINPNQYENDAVSLYRSKSSLILWLTINVELAISHQMDRTTDTEAAPGYQHYMRGNGNFGYDDWARNLLQAGEAIGIQIGVSVLTFNQDRHRLI